MSRTQTLDKSETSTKQIILKKEVFQEHYSEAASLQ